MSEEKNPFRLLDDTQTKELAIIFALADFLAGKLRPLTEQFQQEAKPQLEELGVETLSNQQVSTAMMIIIGFINSNADKEEYDVMEKVFRMIMDQTKQISLTPAPPTSADTIN